MPAIAIPHLRALLFQLRRAFAGAVLANRFPRVAFLKGVRTWGDGCAARSTDRAAMGAVERSIFKSLGFYSTPFIEDLKTPDACQSLQKDNENSMVLQW